MNSSFLGKTGVRVSRLALGTMTFGREADRDAARAMYVAAREAGIDHFDTANVYAEGRSEEILGELISGERDSVVLATKAYFPTGRGPNDRGTSRRHLTRSVEASLRRLRTDRVELFYLHRWDDATDLEETLRAVELLVRSGKVLYPAVSNFAAWQVQKSLGLAALSGFSPLVAIQPMYNLVKRQAEVELLPMAASERLAVFPYSPLGGGLLTGKYSADGAGPGRLAEIEMYRLRYGAAFDVGTRFTTFARERGYDPTALAVAWVASHPAVTAPLLGARSIEQLRPALGALSIPMTPELRAELSALSIEPPPATDRNEEAQISFGSR